MKQRWAVEGDENLTCSKLKGLNRQFSLAFGLPDSCLCARASALPGPSESSSQLPVNSLVLAGWLNLLPGVQILLWNIDGRKTNRPL